MVYYVSAVHNSSVLITMALFALLALYLGVAGMYWYSWAAVVNVQSVYDVRVVDVGVIAFSLVSTLGLALLCLRGLARNSWDITACRHGVSVMMGATAKVVTWRVLGGMLAVFTLTFVTLMALGAMMNDSV